MGKVAGGGVRQAENSPRDERHGCRTARGQRQRRSCPIRHSDLSHSSQRSAGARSRQQRRRGPIEGPPSIKRDWKRAARSAAQWSWVSSTVPSVITRARAGGPRRQWMRMGGYVAAIRQRGLTLVPTGDREGDRLRASSNGSVSPRWAEKLVAHREDVGRRPGGNHVTALSQRPG
ncbi:hypothetical protein THAOC_24434 [Thalassiosira oceanica]|uniref:Uncharacterized protein n=1 Tax=Thalassiosira oceanica TaxID=159749 RepID=K0RPU6_THAOC|nr:hypothetical protein THAOC_24434 [Thalassiosira oceanica]|eukprot:EJK55793.1 hypothetical protein THAOC_24434 [Thalassiosira oceanica]